MWSNPDGQCKATESQKKNMYRYPQGPSWIPGNVIYDPSKEQATFENSTVMFFLVYEVIPTISGVLMLLFSVCTTIYIIYTAMRLLYLDSLKPYRRKTLKTLGKNLYYRRIEAGITGEELGKVQKLKTVSTTTSATSADEKRRKDKLEKKPSKKKQGKSATFLVHPPGQRLSFTSPPQKTTSRTGPHAPGELPGIHGSDRRLPELRNQGVGPDGPKPRIRDMATGEDRPELASFPRGHPSMYQGGNKPLYPSRIPVTTNKKGGPWVWDPNWYKKQREDEDVVSERSAKLLSKTSSLHESLGSREPSPKPTPSSAGVKKEPEEDKDLKKGQGDQPVSPSRLKLFTKIPKKPTKLTYNQQFMILRGAIPKRRNSNKTEKSEISEAGGGENENEKKPD